MHLIISYLNLTNPLFCGRHFGQMGQAGCKSDFVPASRPLSAASRRLSNTFQSTENVCKKDMSQTERSVKIHQKKLYCIVF